MAPDLRLVKGDPQAPAPLASFTHDPRMPSLVSKIGAVAAVALGLAGWLASSLDPSVRVFLGVLAAASAALALQQLLAALGRRSSRYTLTAQRLELERGLFGKRHESVELWRVRDVVLDQSFLDRMRNAGTVTIFSTDQVAPTLVAGPVADAKKVYEAVRDAAQAARRDGRVMTLQQ